MKTFEQFQKQILHESSLNGLKNVSDKLNQAEQLLRSGQAGGIQNEGNQAAFAFNEQGFLALVIH